MSAATLAALDFAPAVVTCDADANRAEFRAVSTCGCIALVCESHAGSLRHVAQMVKRLKTALTCAHCGADPATLDRIERIAA